MGGLGFRDQSKLVGEEGGIGVEVVSEFGCEIVWLRFEDGYENEFLGESVAERVMPRAGNQRPRVNHRGDQSIPLMARVEEVYFECRRN